MYLSYYTLASCSLLLLTSCLVLQNVAGQTNTNTGISPKLDFDDKENKNNTNISNLRPGSRNRGHANNDYDDDVDDDDDDSNVGRRHDVNSGGRVGAGKTGPKIHGVRVTVDTGNGKTTTKESKESVEITDLGKHKKRVGIHTDITFEITANGEHVNATTSGHRHNAGKDNSDDEDASVPIFKGRGGSKSRKPYGDPKSRWNTQNSHEARHGYETSGGRQYPSYGGYYPQYPNNIPVYGQSDASSPGLSSSGTVYRTRDGWTSFVPTSWTTERSFSEYHQSNKATAQRQPTWKPCYCLQTGNDYRKRRASHGQAKGEEVFMPSSSVLHVIDAKLEKPFSRK